ncbi:hypothetical protein [Shimia sp. SK013]|uniref:hypothetical protein n=1 Tax=Shimia sp. SK013 TaxID=1389006 RepID=UPI0006B5141A|nr:hypothetical protein [Shimia sp. SK013]
MAVAAVAGVYLSVRMLRPFSWPKLLIPLAVLFALYIVYNLLVVAFLIFAGAAAPNTEPLAQWVEVFGLYLWPFVYLIGMLVVALTTSQGGADA